MNIYLTKDGDYYEVVCMVGKWVHSRAYCDTKGMRELVDYFVGVRKYVVVHNMMPDTGKPPRA
jgi:hypothetical protein